MCLKTYTEAEGRRAGSSLVTGCTEDTVRWGQGGMRLSLCWPYGFKLLDLVYILSSLFSVSIPENSAKMLSLYHVFVVKRNKEFLIPEFLIRQPITDLPTFENIFLSVKRNCERRCNPRLNW